MKFDFFGESVHIKTNQYNMLEQGCRDESSFQAWLIQIGAVVSWIYDWKFILTHRQLWQPTLHSLNTVETDVQLSEKVDLKKVNCSHVDMNHHTFPVNIVETFSFLHLSYASMMSVPPYFRTVYTDSTLNTLHLLYLWWVMLRLALLQRWACATEGHGVGQ